MTSPSRGALLHLLLLLLLATLCSWPTNAQTAPPVAYQPQLISYPGVPFGPCDIYQVALNVSNGNYYSCTPGTRTWTLLAGGVQTVSVAPSGACVAGQLVQLLSSGALYSCTAGTWSVVTSTSGSGAPANPCTSGATYTDTATGNYYSCSAAAWIFVGPSSQTALSGCTTDTFTSTPTYTFGSDQCHIMTLTGNVTSITIAGSPSNHSALYLKFPEDGTGGRTVTFPGTFILPTGCSIHTAANAQNNFGWQFDTGASLWRPILDFCSAGGGGGSPSGSNGAIQLQNGGSFGNSGNTFDTGSLFKSNEDVQLQGPNPYVDIRAYGARPCDTRFAPCSTGDTATVSLGSPTQATISTISDFVQGDGFVIYGAGPKSMSTAPTGLTAAQSITYAGTGGTGFTVASATGSTTRCYKIAARNFNGAISPASAETCISNALSAEGLTTVNISSWTRSGNIVTLTTASAHPFLAGCNGNGTQCGEVFIGGSSADSTIRGWYAVLSATDSTHITFSTQANTNFGASTSGGAAGTVNAYPCVHLTWSAVTNGWVYYIYEGASGAETLIDVSRVNSTNTDLTYDDYGSTFVSGITSQLPTYVPSTPPAAALGESLFGTISSIAGSVATLSVSASTAVAGATIRLDAGAAIKAAATAVSGVGAINHAGAVYIPGLTNGTFFQYEVNAPLDLHGLDFVLDQAGPLYLNETIYLGTVNNEGIAWYGNRHPQWGGNGGHATVTIERAQPGVYMNSGFGVHVEGLNFNGNSACTNGIRGVLMEGGFRAFWKNDTFTTCAGTADSASMSLIFRGSPTAAVTDFYMDELRFIPGTGGGATFDGGSHTPVWYCHVCGASTWGAIYLTNRGFQYDLVQISQAMINILGPVHVNGGQMPFITTTSNIGNGPGGMHILLGDTQMQNVLMDTIAHPCVAGLGLFPPTVIGPCFPSGVPDVSGQALYRIDGNYNTAPNSKNTDFWLGQVANDGSGQDSLRLFNYHVGTGRNIFANQNAPAAPTCSVTGSGGSGVAVGNWTFKVEPVWQDGLPGSQSAASSTCTTLASNNSITINWTIPSGGPLGMNLYYNFNGTGYVSSNTWSLPFGPGTTSATITTTIASNPLTLSLDPISGPSTMNSTLIASPSFVVGGDVTVSSSFGTPYTVNLPNVQPTSGNTFLSCTAANPSNCSWSAGGAPAWNIITNPTGNLSLSMSTDTSTFSFTSGLANAFQWNNSTAATVSTSASSPQLAICGNAWTGSSNQDCLTIQHIPGNGLNAAITDSYGHSGSSTGTVTSTFPGPVSAGPGTGAAGAIIIPQGTDNSNTSSAITIEAPTAVTAYRFALPGTAPTTGNTLLNCSAATPSLCSWVSVANSTPNLQAWYFAPNCGVSPNCTQIHDDALFLTDCSTTNNSSTVTCPDAVFTSNDVGKTAWVTTAGSPSAPPAYNATIACPITTIATFNSSTSITLTAANDCTSTITGTAILYYGTKDGTTIKNAMNAQCAEFIMPSGSNSSVPGVAKIMIDQPFGNTVATPCNAGFISITGSAPIPSSVVFIITPDFNWSGCTGNNGTSSNICFGAQAINMSYTSFYGGGVNGTGACPAAAQNKIVVGEWATINQNFFLNENGICPGTAGMIGIEFDSLDSTNQFGGAVSVGQFSCVINSQSVTGVANDCTNDGASVAGNSCASGIGVCTGLLVKGGAVYQSFGDQWLENVQNQGTLISHNSYYYATAGNYALTNANGSGGAIHLSDADFFNPTGQPGGLTTTSGGINNDFGSKVYMRNSKIVAGSAGTAINLANDGTAVSFYDECGNTYSGGTIFNNIGNLGQVNNEYCSGNATIATTAKLVLSAGWGSTAAVSALTGYNAPLKFTITNNGTGQGASPTITYTFPTPLLVAPFSCTATQLGGTNPSLNPFTTSSLTATGAVFTATGTPTVNDTEIMQVTCVTP